MMPEGHLQHCWGGYQHSGRPEGHLGPQNIQLHTWRGDTIQEETNTLDSLLRGGLSIFLASQSYIKQRGAEGGGHKDILPSPQGTSRGRGASARWCWCGFGWGSDAAGAGAGDAGDAGDVGDAGDGGTPRCCISKRSETTGSRVCPPWPGRQRGVSA